MKVLEKTGKVQLYWQFDSLYIGGLYVGKITYVYETRRYRASFLQSPVEDYFKTAEQARAHVLQKIIELCEITPLQNTGDDINKTF